MVYVFRFFDDLGFFIFWRAAFKLFYLLSLLERIQGRLSLKLGQTFNGKDALTVKSLTFLNMQ